MGSPAWARAQRLYGTKGGDIKMVNWRRVTSRIPKKWAIIGSAVVGIMPTAAIVTTMTSPASSAVNFSNPVGVAPGAVAARSVIAFPSRDFVSAFGYPGDRVIVRVFHDPVVYADGAGNALPPIVSELSTPNDAAGTVEVNHPGGVCWVGNTPDIRPGDLIQLEVMAGPDAGLIDETVVANVTDKRPVVGAAAGTVVVHGTAGDAPGLVPPGNALPVAQVEQRLVSPGNLFDANGRRTLRATSIPGPGDGLLTFDAIDPDTNPNGLRWTATYAGLTPHDVDLAIGAESRALWLGAVALPAVESTIFENGALTFPGPSAPCLAPIEVLPPPPGSELTPPTDPTGLSALISNSNTVSLAWTASTDNIGVTGYGIYRNGQNIFTVSNPDGSAPAPTTYLDKNVPPGSYTYQVVALDEVGNKSGFSNTTDPVTATSHLAPGTFPVTINEPPVLPTSIIVFPSRDFVSPSGYLPTDLVDVQLLRTGPDGNMLIVSSADGIIPNAEGFAEVNHPGGSCWAGVTPEIRVGDIIRTIAYDPASITGTNPDGVRTIDQTTVAGVSANRPVTTSAPTVGNSDGIVEVHGSALGADGNPIPLAQIEQRMIAVHGVGLWDLNGRRALRAGGGGDGTLTYDTVGNPTGVNWTATYSGLDQADVDRMADADTRIHWLGTKPLLLAEATIYENADNAIPGPSAPGCSSPLEAADLVNPATPAGFTATLALGTNDVTVNWAPSTDDWYVAGYRIYDNGTPVANAAPTATSHLLADLPFGSHTITVRAFDTATPRGAGVGIIAQLTSGRGLMYGNESDATPAIIVIVADVTAPTAPADLVVTTTKTGNPEDSTGTATITWTASSDDVAVDHYVVHRNLSTPGPPHDIGPVPVGTTTVTDIGLKADSYIYTVEAFDAAGNHTTSAPANASVTQVDDIVAPTVPGSVLATTSPDIHGRNVVVTWTASTDAVGVAGYGVYRTLVTVPPSPAVLVATVNSATLSFTDLNRPAGTFTYEVDAFDSSANRSSKSAGSTAVVANDPPVAPHSLIAFPARDFISATGYTPGQSYTFSLIRGATTFFSAPFSADPTGLIEVNHPGGTCWIANTPNIKPGDVIRITDDATGVAEQTTVANITAERPIAAAPGTIVVHGTATNAAGTQIPVEQVESRIIVGTATSFDVNGRRLLRASVAGGDGTLSYDSPTSTNWTAIYTGLTAKDVFRAVGGTAVDGSAFVGAESRGHWLGRNPLALAEATIFENGPLVVGGPSAPCTAPAEPGFPAASTNVSSRAFPPTQFVPAPTATSAPLSVQFSNGGGSALTISNIYVAGANTADFLVVPGVGTCPTVFPAQLAAGTSCLVNIRFKPTALGLRQANVSFSDDAANTTDQTVTLTGLGADNTDPILTITNAQPVTFATVNGGGATSTRVITVTNTGTGLPLLINSARTTGDFTATPTGCASVSNVGTAPANLCTVTVVFKPTAIGARTGTLVLNHIRTLNGATSTTVTLTGNGGTGSVLGFTSTNITYGTVNRNTTKDQKIVVKNTGNAAAALNLGSFTVVGANFTKVSTDCGTLAVNGSCSVTVRYSAPNVVGSFAGTVSVSAANSFNTASAALTVTTR